MLDKALTHSYDHLFPYIRIEGKTPVPPPDPRAIDVAILDMNHSWPNVGHNALVHAVREVSSDMLALLDARGLVIRVLSFDVRRSLRVPEPSDRFRLYLGTGGPGHLDPRRNQGEGEESQGISEDPSWEARIFRLFDSIESDPETSLLAVCHTFGVLCRWKRIADAVMREQKSSGIPQNVLSPEALAHPWFSRFAAELPDGRHFHIVDNRLFDLIPTSSGFPAGITPLSFEHDGAPGDAVTMIELARDRDGVMPRILAVNHHPEIVDREHQLSVLEEKRERGEVSEMWFEERRATFETLLTGEIERQSRLTSRYTLIEPLRFQLSRLVRERAGQLGAREAEPVESW